MKIFTSKKDNNFEILILFSFFYKKPISYEFKGNFESKREFINFILLITTKSSYSITKNIITFHPGALVGGDIQCKTNNLSKTILPTIIIGLFSRNGLILEAEGITNQSTVLEREVMNESDILVPKIKAYSMDMLKIAYCKLFKRLNIDIQFDIQKRGFDLAGGGSIKIKINRVNQLDSFAFKKVEKLYKIRGLVITSRISADYSYRMINMIKTLLKDFNDVKIHNILGNKNDCGESPGFDCSLYAENKNGIIYTTTNRNKSKTPENVAKEACKKLLKRVAKNNIFDSQLIPCIFSIMFLSKNISYLKMHRIRRKERELLELAKELLGIEYSILNEEDGYLLAVVGCGYINTAVPL